MAGAFNRSSKRNALGAAKLQALGVQATSSTPDAFGTFIRQETRRYAAILRDIGAKPD